jgi:hypothetical protein
MAGPKSRCCLQSSMTRSAQVFAIGRRFGLNFAIMPIFDDIDFYRWVSPRRGAWDYDLYRRLG